MTTTNNLISLEEKIEDILLPAFGASVMVTLMEGKCTDGVIKIRDETIQEMKDLFLSLPTINLSQDSSLDTTISEIDKMIDEIKNGIDPGHVTMLSAKATLEELKSRLSPKL